MAAWIYPLPRLADGRAPRIFSGFGEIRGTKIHRGADLLYPTAPGDPPYPGRYTANRSPSGYAPDGLPVFAVAAGEVVRVLNSERQGIAVYVLHDDGRTTVSRHLSSARVATGAKVAAGDTLGIWGASRDGSRLIHLHFEIYPGAEYLNGRQIDPAPDLLAAQIVAAPASASASSSGSGVALLAGLLLAAKFLL